MKSLLTLTLIFSLLGCASINVNYDYDKETEFSAYTTYNYYPDLNTGMNELDDRRLLDAIDSYMQTKGILLVEEPEFYINIKSAMYQSPSNSSVGFGVGGGGGSVGGGVSMGIPVGQGTMNHRIQFDFVDRQKDAMFWQAISESSFKPKSTPEAKEVYFKSVVEKVFSKYPPKK
ncbi:DUF4136 domain-containing protein [Flavobacteriaceae bacterium F89]|uniref:DUF4136 domain-containing protein n=1 Tax=Cerina litoralis TaxID=2874477 RepID=A0AAE3JP44_9FLAO|nr:DUF4136 domain-containing protein [Cerina litoralis]MCG2461745.1 DUF4136 domain-containing protein [Cerina litoralis]